jgi:hypothetical protein
MITVAGAVVGVAAGSLIGFTWLRGVDEVMPGMSFHFPGPIVIAVAVAAVVLGVIAAILPARRAAAPAAATRSCLLRQALMSPCGLKTNFLAAPLSKSS